MEKKYQPHIVVRKKTEQSPAKILRILTEEDSLPQPDIDLIIDDDIYALLQTFNDEVL